MKKSRNIIVAVCLLCISTQAALGESVGTPVSERTERVYRAGKSPDPAMARRVTMALGEGRHVVARLHTGKTYRGHLEQINYTQFSIRLDHDKGFVAIPYTDVAYLEQNLTKAAKILIGVGVGVAAVLAGLFIWGEVCCE